MFKPLKQFQTFAIEAEEPPEIAPKRYFRLLRDFPFKIRYIFTFFKNP